MKVSIYLDDLREGGIQRVMLNLASGIAGRGHETHLLLGKAAGAFRDELQSGVQMMEVGGSNLWARVSKLHSYIHRERPEALIVTRSRACLEVLLCKRLTSAPTRVIASVHSMAVGQLFKSHRWHLPPKYFLYPLTRIPYGFADIVVAISLALANDLVRLPGLSRKKVRVIYNPVVSPQVYERARQPVKHLWFKPGEPPVILGVGRLDSQKDFPTLVRAFALVRRERLARLLILGEGKGRSRLEALARRLGVEGDVGLPGFVTNPYAYMKRAGVFVLSSAWEGLPTVLIEAMAVGTPVVSTDCPSGPSEILDGGKWGRLVPVGDAEAMAKAIIDTLDSPPDTVAIRNRAEEFSVDTAVDKYLEVLGAR